MTTAANSTSVKSDDIQTLGDAIIKADIKTGRRIVNEISAEYGPGILITEVLDPLLIDIGRRLKFKQISLAQSYVVSLMVDDMLRLYQNRGTPHGRDGGTLKGPVVLANIEDDCHPLGRKILATLLRVHDWDVYDLGIDVEARVIVEKAIEIGARVIGVSAMIYTTAENILNVRDEINRRGYEHKIKLAVGGAVFRLRPELTEQVGADGTAQNALSALSLFDELWKQAKGWEP